MGADSETEQYNDSVELTLEERRRLLAGGLLINLHQRLLMNPEAFGVTEMEMWAVYQGAIELAPGLASQPTAPIEESITEDYVPEDELDTTTNLAEEESVEDLNTLLSDEEAEQETVKSSPSLQPGRTKINPKGIKVDKSVPDEGSHVPTA
jgi:hypothetical protein